jgi:electron transfer flavoprotein beta subunit
VLQLEREVEEGRRQRFRLPLPALLTIQSGIHAPRYPALSHMLRSRSQVIETMAASPPAAHPGAPLLRLPPRRLPGRLLQGTAEEKARQLLAALHAAGHLSWG